MPGEARDAGVQSVARAFGLLELLADAGGEATLSELATASGLPLPTIHRLIRTLVSLGYVRQHATRRYALGPRIIRLGELASRQLGSWARPFLAELVDRLGETANLAILDGDEVVYVAQVPSRHSMRMFTEVGRHVLPHATGVGKAILAQLPPAEARAILGRCGMPAFTPHTITDVDMLLRQLAEVRAQAYAVDEGEQEIGVRCVAVPLAGSPTPAAVSISGPEGRVTRDAVRRVVPVMQQVVARLAQTLTGRATA